MPARKRYALPPKPHEFSEYERSVSLQDDFMRPAPGEAEWVETYTTPEGLDPVEAACRKDRTRYKTEAERIAACQRILPHRSTVNETMAAVHERRFAMWLSGLSYNTIADIEDVDNTAVIRSIGYGKSLLTREEIFRANAQHVANRAMGDCADQVTPAITALLTASNWKAKSSGLTHFRRTTLMEVPAGVNVLVDNRKQSAVINAGPTSFEEIMDRVRTRLLAERNATRDCGPTTDDGTDDA